MNGAKLASLGWQPTTKFEAGLATTVEWFNSHAGWWRAAKSGNWTAYYEEQYGWRLAQSVDARL